MWKHCFFVVRVWLTVRSVVKNISGFFSRTLKYIYFLGDKKIRIFEFIIATIRYWRPESGVTEINTIFSSHSRELKLLKAKSIKILVIILAFLLVFLIRYGWYTRTHVPLLDGGLGRGFETVGVVVEEPEEKSFYQEVIIEVSNVGSSLSASPSLWFLNSKQKILIKAPFYPKFTYGDEVRAKGVLKYPKDFKTDSGRTFPYVNFLAKDNVYYLMTSSKVTLLSERNGARLKHVLFDIKNSFIGQIHKILPRPESSLLSGMLIAGKGGLGSDLEQKFKDTGLIHIVVLSGYNVTIVAEAFIKILSFVPRLYGYSAGMFGIILFAVMAGGGTTIIRASAMAIIALYAKWTGNTYNAFRALVVSGACMILLNPLTLLYDPSFHLSFMATFALIVFTPYTQKMFGSFGETAIGQIISSTLTIELFLLPYLLWMNGEFAVVAFLANVAVLSFIPATMLAGFVAVVVSYVYFALSYPFAVISFITLHYVMRIVEIASLFTDFAIRW